MCILHLKHIALWMGHISCALWPQVASAFVLEKSVNYEVIEEEPRLKKWNYSFQLYSSFKTFSVFTAPVPSRRYITLAVRREREFQLFSLSTYFWISVDKHLTLKIQLANWWADRIPRNGNEEDGDGRGERIRNEVDLQKPGAVTGKSNVIGNNKIDIMGWGKITEGVADWGPLGSTHIRSLKMLVKMQIHWSLGSELWCDMGSWQSASLISFLMITALRWVFESLSRLVKFHRRPWVCKGACIV